MRNELKFWRYSIPSIEGEGWGIFLMDSTGIFSAVSDYGNYAYFWPIHHTGYKDIREFLASIDGHYLLGKVAPSKGRVYEGDLTHQKIRETIASRRRQGYLSEQEARKEWKLLESIDFYYREGFSEWYQQTSLPDAHEEAIYGYSASERAFADILFPRLRTRLLQDLNSESATLPVERGA